MESFEISDANLVGDYLMDAQHKAILDYMAGIYAKLLAGKKQDEVFTLVDALDTYCKLHFIDEEKMLDEISFPESNEHKAQHVLFVTHLENFMGKYDQQNLTNDVDEFLFLKGWFLEHIKTFDKQYAQHRRRTFQQPEKNI